jgi:hypothetical protein
MLLVASFSLLRQEKPAQEQKSCDLHAAQASTPEN